MYKKIDKESQLNSQKINNNLFSCYNIYEQFIKTIKKNKYFVLFLLTFTGIITFIYYYFVTLLNNNNETFVNNSVKLLEDTIIDRNSNIIDYIERSLTTQRESIQKSSFNMSQNDFYLISRSDLDPFSDVYNNYRFSRVVFKEERNYYNNFGKNHIHPNFEIKDTNYPNAPTGDFYIPVEYTDPDIFTESNGGFTFGYDLNNLQTTSNNFFNKFKNITDRVIGVNIAFGTSVDEQDSGMYCGFINYKKQYCNITYSSSFENLINSNFNLNKNNDKCILGFNYIAILIRDYIDNVLNNIGSLPNISPEEVPYIVIDNNNNDNNKVISRSEKFFEKNIKSLSDVEDTIDEYYKNIRIDNFFKFRTNSINDDITVYLFLDENIKSEEIDSQIFTLHVLIPCLYFVFIIGFIAIYYLHKKNINTSNEKYIETKKLMTYVNHELRNPLNIIYGLSQLTEKKIINIIYDLIETKSQCCLTDVNIEDIVSNNINLADFNDNHHKKVYENLKQVHSNIMTINNSARISSIIVSDILDLQKLEDNRIAISESYFTCLSLINDFYKSVLYKSNEIVSKIDTFIYIDPIICFYTDKDRLIQIIVNIYSNSVKYTKEGKIVIIIKFSSSKEKINIIISDTGIGIEEKIKNDVFSKTFINNTSSINSVGIGLYIVGMISKLLDYNIRFDTKENVGTIFYIDIENTSKIKFDEMNINNQNLIYQQIKDKVIFIESDKFNVSEHINNIHENYENVINENNSNDEENQVELTTNII